MYGMPKVLVAILKPLVSLLYRMLILLKDGIRGTQPNA